MHTRIEDHHGISKLDALTDVASSYHGLRMSASEYLDLPEDVVGRYELIDGVVCMTPSPLFQHQFVVTQLIIEIGTYLRTHPVGLVVPDIDVPIGKGPSGDIVYRPDIVFLRRDPAGKHPRKIQEIPAMVVEVISWSSRRQDLETKKSDYERVGISEYWVIDPEMQNMVFYRHQEGRYVDVTPKGDSFASEAIPGFALNLAGLRAVFGADNEC